MERNLLAIDLFEGITLRCEIPTDKRMQQSIEAQISQSTPSLHIFLQSRSMYLQVRQISCSILDIPISEMLGLGLPWGTCTSGYQICHCCNGMISHGQFEP